MYTHPFSSFTVRAGMAALLLALGSGMPASALPGGGKTPRSIIEAQSDDVVWRGQRSERERWGGDGRSIVGSLGR